MSRIFVSYRRSDDPGYAGRLYDRLTAHFGDGNVFMDLTSIPLGIDFGHYIERTMDTVDALIAVIGPTWLTCVDETGTRRLDRRDDFVRLEIGHALTRDIRVIPVLVRGAKMPMARDLPKDLRALSRRNGLSISDLEWQAGVARLLESLENALGAAPAAAVPAAQRSSGRELPGRSEPRGPMPSSHEVVVAEERGLRIVTHHFRVAGFPISGYWPEGLADVVVTTRRLIVRPHAGGEAALDLDAISFTMQAFGRIEVYAQDTSKNLYIELPDDNPFPDASGQHRMAALDRAIGRK